MRITEFIEETAVRLGRDIRDLDDVRHSMGALESIRQNQIEFDMNLGPIEVSTTRLDQWCFRQGNQRGNV